jgi:hypothetical protein
LIFRQNGIPLIALLDGGDAKVLFGDFDRALRDAELRGAPQNILWRMRAVCSNSFSSSSICMVLLCTVPVPESSSSAVMSQHPFHWKPVSGLSSNAMDFPSGARLLLQ